MNPFLLFAAGGPERWISQLLQPEVLVVIAVLAPVFMSEIGDIFRAVIKHRERMAKIERGIDPDARPR